MKLIRVRGSCSMGAMAEDWAVWVGMPMVPCDVGQGGCTNVDALEAVAVQSHMVSCVDIVAEEHHW
jgi:hypothetical protein